MATVTVGLEIDEGGGMVQRSFATFQLAQRDGRWLIRPEVPPVERWLRAARRAWDSRMRATNETVVAQAEADRIEPGLQRDDAEEARARREQERTRRLVEAREQTEDDRRRLEQLDLEERLLRELRDRLR